MTTSLNSVFRRSKSLRYGTAIVITSAALALKLLLVPLVTPDIPFLVFFAAVIVSAVLGGLGPGLLATALAAVFDNYFFMEPYGRFGFGEVEQQVRFALFVGESAVICVICARLQAARENAETSAAEARELERRILEITDEEQRRIGHDLHDGLGQHLTGITLIAKRLEQRLAAMKSPDTAEAEKLSNLARTAVEWTHDLSRTLSPPALQSAGLAEALRELAAHVESIFDIECTFDPVGDIPPIDLPAAVHLYRIAQEAISNAVRHGRASHIQIHIQSAGPGIVVRILDNGTGIQPAPASSDGMGLRIMRYRARMIGAQIDVRPRDVGGTEIACNYAPNRTETN